MRMLAFALVLLSSSAFADTTASLEADCRLTNGGTNSDDYWFCRAVAAGNCALANNGARPAFSFQTCRAVQMNNCAITDGDSRSDDYWLCKAITEKNCRLTNGDSRSDDYWACRALVK